MTKIDIYKQIRFEIKLSKHIGREGILSSGEVVFKSWVSSQNAKENEGMK